MPDSRLYSLSLHDALPICGELLADGTVLFTRNVNIMIGELGDHDVRSEEHTSELQSHLNLVCRLLLEKKNAGCFRLRRNLFSPQQKRSEVAASRLPLNSAT